MAFREVLTVTAGKSRSAASSAQLIARDASRRASISGEIGESSTTEYLDGTPRPRFASRHSARSADAEASRMRAEANLFIGDLAKEVTEEELETAFGRYGRVLGVDVKRDRATSSSLGYGFVQYSTRREASEGKRALHRHEMHGRSIRVGWAQKNTNLFVGDLDASVTNDKLRTAFRAFGPIVEEDTFMKGDNYGFVRFRHRVHAVAEADEAVVVPLHERVLFDDRPEGAKGCAQLVVRDRRIEVANEQIRVLLGPADADRPPVHLVAVERALALRRLAARRVLNETVPQARRRCAVALHVHTEHPPVPAKGRLELLLCHFLGQVADEKIRLCAHATRLSVGTACGVAGSEARARRAVEVLGGTALADLAAD